MTGRKPRQASIASRQGPSIADAIAAQRQLTPRDLCLLGLLASHRALTPRQITRVLFEDDNTARKRLVLLTGRGVLARFRACIRPGSQEYRYTLGPLGAMIHAAAHDAPIPSPRTVHEKTLKLSINPQLNHLLGINEFFTTLCYYGRNNPGCALRKWRNERDATKRVAQIARPDGYGEWTENGRTISFHLEYDTGTEELSRLIDKLHGYQELCRAVLCIPVLFVLPGTRRQTNLHRILTEQPATITGLTVATATVAELARDTPAGPVWWLAGHTTRHRLIDLAAPQHEQDGPHHV